MSFYTDVIAKSPLFHSVETVKDLELLEPVTRAAVLAIIADAKAMGKELRILETYRSRERQFMLWRKGLTKLKQVGCHSYGIACDLGYFINGRYIGDGSQYKFLIDLANKHGLISGFDWGEPNKKHTFRDVDHVQRVSTKDQPRLFAGNWYPDDQYSPHATMIAKA